MTNPFESGARKIIPAVLIYARYGDRVLLIHRVSPDRPDDYHAGKWNGLGGKLEPDESPVQGARREFREESGIDVAEERFLSLGLLQFPNFKAHKCEDWMVWVLAVDLTAEEAGGVTATTSEGNLHWIEMARISDLSFWPGDHYFLPFVLRRAPFVGTFWYRGQLLERHWIQGLAQL